MVCTYIYNIARWLDQGVNALAGGDPREPVSQRIGRVKSANGGVVPKYRWVMFVVSVVLNAIDKNHCLESINNPEMGSMGVMDTPEQLEN
jgi:hypothetical protein